MISFTKTKVPSEILDQLEPIKNDDEEVRKFGNKNLVQMCTKLIERGNRFLHFYTMNLE